MGTFVPDENSIYWKLCDWAFEAIGQSTPRETVSFDGDFSSRTCHFFWSGDLIRLGIVTPTALSTDLLPREELGHWTERRRCWKRRTGLIQIACGVSQQQKHFDWLDVAKFAEPIKQDGDSLSRKFKSQLTELNEANHWFEPEFERDGTFSVRNVGKRGLRSVRRVSLFRNDRYHLVWGQALSVFGTPALGYPVFLMSCPDFGDNQRTECITLEFALSGEDSYNYYLE